MIDTATVARALSRTLGGEWHHIESAEVFFNMHTLKEVADPREDTDVCLEMLAVLPDAIILFRDYGWLVTINSKVFGPIPTNGQPFRDAVIRLCAGEE